MPPNSSFIMKHTPTDKKGVGSSLMLTLRGIGSMFGICLFEALFTRFLPPKVSTAALGIHQATELPFLLKGYRSALLMAVGVFILAIVFTLFIEIKMKNNKLQQDSKQ